MASTNKQVFAGLRPHDNSNSQTSWPKNCVYLAGLWVRSKYQTSLAKKTRLLTPRLVNKSPIIRRGSKDTLFGVDVLGSSSICFAFAIFPVKVELNMHGKRHLNTVKFYLFSLFFDGVKLRMA